MRIVLLNVCAVGILTISSLAAQSATARANPFDTPEGITQGRTLFQTHCSYCHGALGEGGKGADLTSGRYRLGGSEIELFATVRNGIGSEMPAVRASDDDVWKMVAFVKKIGSSGISETASGDPVAGKGVYGGKGGCAACHAIGREGGNLGPELTEIGRRRSLAYLRESLVEPNADVALSYRTLLVVTKKGQTVSGVRLNEDDLSIQLRDRQDNLRSFLKENLREIQRNRPSLMPSYRSALSTKELDDIVAYLNSLRGAP